MQGNLDTTNLLLGIMAVVSVLEALLLIGVGVGAMMAYRRVMTLVNGIEERQIAPAMARVNAILDNLKNVSATVKQETERVDQAIRATIDRVDDTADRMRSQVRAENQPRRRVGARHARRDRDTAGGQRARHADGAARVENRALKIRRNDAEPETWNVKRRRHG